ncbi:N-acetylglucosamine-6-phosphate deacetylase, partial [Mobiluncus curtisii]|nr:N-acetylglucosamine-6-phosphate deacetylase [Mobiluncus curtisii]
MTIYRADTLFDGNQVLGPGAVRVENDRIVEVFSGPAVAQVRADVDFGSAILAPGFVDIHSHGGG